MSLPHLMEIYHKQESPPAWTQEAYRPPCSKCSLCCSVSWWGGGYIRGTGGYLIQSWMGGTPSWTWDGVPHISWMGYPHLDLEWGTPLPGPGMGYPRPSQLDGVPPTWTWDGVPPSAGWSTPFLNLGWGYPPCWLDGVPPPQNVDRQTPVKTVPSLVFRTQAVNMDDK